MNLIQEQFRLIKADRMTIVAFAKNLRHMVDSIDDEERSANNINKIKNICVCVFSFLWWQMLHENNSRNFHVSI